MKRKQNIKSVTRTGAWRPVFLEALYQTGLRKEAFRRARVSRDTAYRLRRKDPEFAKAWDEALGSGLGGPIKHALNDELVRRAMKGNTACLIFANKTLGGLHESGRMELTGKDGGPIESRGKMTIDLSGFNDDELLRIERAFTRDSNGTGEAMRN